MSLDVKIKSGCHLLRVAYEDGDSVCVTCVRRVGERLESNLGIPRRNYYNA